MPFVRIPLTLALLITALLASFGLMSLGPASAGGPTSALLSVPGEGATASLYYTDPDYDALADLVGITGDQGTVGSPGQSFENQPGVTVTWLIHDVMPWRVDHIYLTGKGAPWIATQIAAENGHASNAPRTWHQPDSPKELGALLDRLGVGAAAREAGNFEGVAGAAVPAPAETESEAPAAATPEQSSAIPGIGWGLAGLAGGLLLSQLWTRARRGRAPAAAVRRGRAPAAAVPASGNADDDPREAIVATDKLAWPRSRP